MNLKDARYSGYALVQEMMQTTDVVRKFNPRQTRVIALDLQLTDKLFLTGEGSSRLFPAKNTIRKALTWGLDLSVFTEGAHQAARYDLSEMIVFCASNSGKTKEVVQLARDLAASGAGRPYGLSANQNTLLEKECKKTFILNCGWESAVAATKSVVEQALFFESILWNIRGIDMTTELKDLPGLLEETLSLPISREIVKMATDAPTIYFAGYNDGVAEELTLKTNEITGRKSDYLEGTYAVHGIEEVMEKQDIVFVIDPIDEEIEKFQEVLIKGVGLNVIAIADRETPFTTIRVPSAGEMNPYIFLCTGWNLLVEIGLALGINLDKPTRARKVGNEFMG